MIKRNQLYLRIVIFVLALSQLVSNFIFFNEFANTSLSQTQSHIYFLPAPFTFSIWGVIILLSIVYGFFQLRPQSYSNRTASRILFPLGIVFVGFSLWLFLASKTGEYFSFTFKPNILFGTVIVIVGMLIAAGQVYLVSDKSVEKPSSLSLIRSLLTGTYFGWLTVATIANITAYIYAMSFNVGLDGEIWGVLLTSAASLITLAVIRNTRTVPQYLSFGLTIIWALFGLLISNRLQSNAMVIASAIGMCAITGMLLARFVLPLVLRNKYS